MLKRGRPLLLGSLSEKVQKFLMALHSKGGVVSTVVAVTVAKTLNKKSSDEWLKVLDLDNSYWAKSIFVRMSFVKRDYTTAQPEIPEGAQKEAELIFHIIINIDQTPLKFARLLKPNNGY